MPHNPTPIRKIRFWLLTAVLMLAVLALPTTAFAGASVSGAEHAVERAVAEEGGTVMWYGTPYVRCRRTLPAHFGCSFSNFNRGGLGGRVAVVYTHRHYYVSEAVYEEPRELGSPRMPCYQSNGC
jgi:hypothetical protein